MTADEMKFYKAAGDDGGVISTTEIVDGQMNNLMPDVTATDAEAGATVYRKFFIKNTNASDTAKSVKVCLISFTPADDFVNIFPGTADDTTANFTNTKKYGIALATAELDRATKEVACSTEAQQALSDIFEVGDTILFVNRSDDSRIATATVATVNAGSLVINEDIPADIVLNDSYICNAVAAGDLAPDGSFGVWVRQDIPAYASAYEDPPDNFKISVYFDG